MSKLFTDVELWRINGAGNLLARGTVVVANSIKVNFTFVRGANGNFVSLPQEKVTRDGKTQYFAQVRPLSRELSEELNVVVNLAYNGMPDDSTTQSVSNNSNTADDDLPF